MVERVSAFKIYVCLNLRFANQLHIFYCCVYTKRMKIANSLLFTSISDINELTLPKTCQVDFPDPDDLLNFKLIISPDEVNHSIFKCKRMCTFLFVPMSMLGPSLVITALCMS